MKVCTVCRLSKDLSEYYNNARSKDKKGYRCKACDNKTRKRSRANSEGTALGYRRRACLNKYGITLEVYAEMLTLQGNKCAICETDNPVGEGNTHKFKSFSFAVDHCHTTGKVRGLLCNTCNRGLGLLKDSPELLQRALKYLKVTCH